MKKKKEEMEYKDIKVISEKELDKLAYRTRKKLYYEVVLPELVIFEKRGIPRRGEDKFVGMRIIKDWSV